jgi:transposase
LLVLIFDFRIRYSISNAPKQFASGNKSVNGGITKRGDGYLRKQLVHGAIVSHASKKNDDLNQWITQLRSCKSICTTVVATAHRLDRLMWTLLHKQVLYTPQYGTYQGSINHEAN